MHSAGNLVFDKFFIICHLKETVGQVQQDEIRELGEGHKEKKSPRPQNLWVVL